VVIACESICAVGFRLNISSHPKLALVLLSATANGSYVVDVAPSKAGSVVMVHPQGQQVLVHNTGSTLGGPVYIVDGDDRRSEFSTRRKHRLTSAGTTGNGSDILLIRDSKGSSRRQNASRTRSGSF